MSFSRPENVWTERNVKFLYLLSPSARKSAPHRHEAHHDSHGHGQTLAQTESAPEPEVVMKDDEGTEANVTESIHQAEVRSFGSFFVAFL